MTSHIREQEVDVIAKEKEAWLKRFNITTYHKIHNDVGMEVQTVYAPSDLQDADYLRDIGFPGQYPFTRGPYPEMSRFRPWRFAILSGFGTPEDTNQRWKLLLKGGQRSFTWVPDLPTQAGVDSDDPRAEGEVGKVGMAVDTAKDLEILYSDLPIAEVPFSPNVEGTAPMILAMHIAATEKMGIPLEKLAGTVANDPLAHSIIKGYFLLPIRGAVKLATDCTEFCVKNIPSFYPTNLKGGAIWELGGTLDQEIGYTFSMAIEYTEQLLKRGINIDEFAPKITFFLGCGHQLFEEVAKFRAARRLWARLMKERYHAQNISSMRLKFTCYGVGSPYQVEWPELNLVRGTIIALAGAMGGAGGMLLPAWDEPFAIPTPRSHALALGTQQIIAEEIGVTKTVDPLGGSYYVEYLTNYIEKEATKRMEEIERYGGVIKAIEDGYMQKECLTNYYKKIEQIESGERVIVRKNKYTMEEENRELELHHPSPESARRQIERLKRFKLERDNTRVKNSLKELENAAKNNINLMPYLIEAARCYASIGEMTATLKAVFGTFKEPLML